MLWLQGGLSATAGSSRILPGSISLNLIRHGTFDIMYVRFWFSCLAGRSLFFLRRPASAKNTMSFGPLLSSLYAPMYSVCMYGGVLTRRVRVTYFVQTVASATVMGQIRMRVELTVSYVARIQCG